MKRFLLPVVVLTVLSFSYPADSQNIKDVTISNPVSTKPVPSEIISLASPSNVTGVCTHGAPFYEKTRDLTGGGANQIFAVPPGKVFIITSLQWVDTNPAAPNRLTGVDLVRQVAGAYTLITGGYAMSDSDGRVAGSISMPSGLVWQSGTTVCLGGGNHPVAYAQGYLADDI